MPMRFTQHVAAGKYSDAQRGTSTQRGYDVRWRKLRNYVLANEPMCRMCVAIGVDRPASAVDHIEPIIDAPHRRLDITNLQPLCLHHHNSEKQRHDKAKLREKELDLIR